MKKKPAAKLPVKKNERLQALHILTALLQDKTPLSHLMQAAHDLSPFSKELCFGVCRQYYRLEAIADCLVDKRPKQLDIWVCLLLGLYQLHFLRIPDYAVVKESVALLTPIKKTWAKGLMNAVLRTYCREQESILNRASQKTAFIYGHPDWLIKRIKKSWPSHWQVILEANDTHPPMSLRVNQRHHTAAVAALVNPASQSSDFELRSHELDCEAGFTSAATAAYLSTLHQANIEAHIHPFASHGIVLNTPCGVLDLPGFSQGDVSVQDNAAQLVVELLDLKPGLRLLDACCAPGGKTCHILETEPNLALCVGLDIEKSRLARVQDNFNRLNLKGTLIQGDGLKPQEWWDGVPFDRILLDAPCSATGVIRRHPDIKLLRTEDEIKAITDLQRELLNTMWSILAPGGVMVYATCSIMPEENEQQIAAFINQNSDCEFNACDKPWGHSTGHGWQILPGEYDMDGFFYSVFRKSI